MGRYNEKFKDYLQVRTIIEHLDDIAEIMEKKYGIDDTCLKYVGKDLKTKFLKQQQKLFTAIEQNNSSQIEVHGRAMIKAWKIVDGICEDANAKKIYYDVWQTKHSNLPDVIVNVCKSRKQLPLGQARGQSWISVEGLVNSLPQGVFEVKKEFAGSRVTAEVDKFFDDKPPF